MEVHVIYDIKHLGEFVLVHLPSAEGRTGLKLYRRQRLVAYAVPQLRYREGSTSRMAMRRILRKGMKGEDTGFS